MAENSTAQHNNHDMLNLRDLQVISASLDTPRCWTTGMSGIRWKGDVDLQIAWSTAFAPADDQQRCWLRPGHASDVPFPPYPAHTRTSNSPALESQANRARSFAHGLSRSRLE
jgi:hypothetical protein